MFIDSETFFLLPPLWHVGLLLIVALSFEAFLRRHEYWAFPALMVYLTTWFWYYPDFNIRWEKYSEMFGVAEMDLALGQLVLFLGAFRWMLPAICRWCQGHEAVSSKVPIFQNVTLIVQLLALLWLGLLVIGVLTHGRGLFHALFPIDSRSHWSFMFGRERIGGQWDWLISIAGYSYKIVVMLLGFTLFLPKKPTMQAVNVAVVLLALPYFMFVGTRTGFLEVVAPIGLGVFFLSRIPIATKLTILVWFAILVNAAMIFMIQYRNVGFGSFFEEAETNLGSDVVFHDGANMLEEMMWVNFYLQDGSLQMAYGYNYLAMLTQMIPRPLWPDKPTPGDRFTILRGFTSQGGDTAFGSVATGFVGQGMWEFGSYLGPISVALIFALYCGWITRLWVQDHSLLRSCLALAAVVFIFNLGRGITLLAIWPIIFGYVLVRGVELMMYYSTYERRERPVLAQDRITLEQDVAEQGVVQA